MAETPKYKKLPGSGMRGAGSFGVSAARARLWLAEDHLLNVDTISYTEEYRRFYFRDIQAFVIRRTYGHMVYNAIFGIAAVLFLTGTITVDPDGRLFVGGFFLLFASLLAWSLWMGTSCRCYIQTAVQFEQLPSLNRLRNARKVMTIVRERILKTQGAAFPGRTPPLAPATAQPAAAVAPPPDTVEQIPAPPPPPAGEPPSAPPI